MAPSTPYQLLADAVLLLHFGIVLFVVGGLALVVAGNMLDWPWVNSLWLRLAHTMAIGIVVAQAWLGEVCPLTTLESWLRAQAGSPSYSKSFVEHWVERLLFYEAPAWVFTLAYTVFGLLVVAAWWYFPPRYNKHAHETQRIMRTRVFLWYVVGYLVITGVALLVAPSASLRLMLSTADYGEETHYWHGLDITLNARLTNGLLFQGGTSTGRGVSDTCDVLIGRFGRPMTPSTTTVAASGMATKSPTKPNK